MAHTRKTFAHVAPLPYLASASAVHATGTMPSAHTIGEENGYGVFSPLVGIFANYSRKGA